MPDPLDPLAEPGRALPRPAPPRTWRERAAHLADATGTTPARLLLGGVAVVVAGAVVLVATRPAPAPPEIALPFASTTALPGTTSTTAPAELVVHVAGAVQRPGVHRLPPLARVVDAVDAAGGLTPTADGARLNLAALVVDGERVYVPAVGEALPPPLPSHAPGGAPGRAGGAGALVDLNRADEAALDVLPGVGPATAAAIVEHRQRIGGFTAVDQLLDVRGIGEAKLEQLRPLVTV
jgi:competence protein ComEA